MLWNFGGAQAFTESRQTGAWLVVGSASRPVLEEMSSSWRLGLGIAEAMRGSALGATHALCKDRIVLTKTSTGQEALHGNIGRNPTNPKSGGENRTGDACLQLFPVGYSCALQLFPYMPHEVQEDHRAASQ